MVISEIQILEYLSSLHSENYSYSVINSHKSAIIQTLLTCNKDTNLDQSLIARFMKGIFNLHPPKPKYIYTWDVNVVLKYLSTLFPLSKLCLQSLTLKVAALLALCSAQRTQTLIDLDLNHMLDNGDKMIFSVPSLMKTSKPGSHTSPVEFHSFHDKKLCVVTTIKHYIKITGKTRKSTKLLVSFKTHKSISTSTLARWLKLVLMYSGINTRMFQAHSFRGASSSAAYKAGVSLESIMKTANWAHAQTFYKFYLRKTNNDTHGCFSNAVLSSSSNN